MRLQIFVWLRRRVRRRKPSRPASVLDAIEALRVGGLTVTPCGDDFQHWQMGDFIMTDAAVIELAVSTGVIGDR